MDLSFDHIQTLNYFRDKILFSLINKNQYKIFDDDKKNIIESTDLLHINPYTKIIICLRF
jgi:hypothetical protein